MISMNYTFCKLNDVLLDMHSGGTPSTDVKEYWDGNIKWLSSGETSKRFIYDTINKITKLGVQKSSTKLAKKESIVMACAGQGKTRGQTSFLLDDMYINQSVIAMQTNSKILPLYLFYDLSNRYEELRGGSDSSSTRGSITTTKLRKIPFKYPLLENQHRITTILYNYDKLIESNNKRIEILENMADFLYKKWYLNSKETCERNNLGKLLTDYFNGGWGKDEQEIKEKNPGYVIRGTDIPDILSSFYECVPLRYHSNNDINNKQLEENDIIMEMSNGNINNIGRTLLISKDLIDKYKNVMCASFCKVMRFKNKKDTLSALFLIRYLQDSGKMFFYKNTGTNGINNFNFKRFLKQDVYLLDNDIYFKLEKLYSLANVYRQENYNYIKQRDLLLPRLMSGKLSVEGKEVI